jgi:hypothetical protein
MKKTSYIFIALIVVFIATRFLAFDLIYHQDEYKWARIVDPQFEMGLESDHPPLVAALYKITGLTFGFDNLRLLPIAVSILNVILVYLIARKMYGKGAALCTLGVLSVSVYYLIATTMIDIDGALLPFFGLLAIFAYLRLDRSNLRAEENRHSLMLLFAACVGGFLIKLSFLLFIIALVADYLISHRPSRGEAARGIIFFGGVVVCSSIAVLILNSVLGVEHSSRFIENTTRFSFLNILDRNYTQVLFLTIKSIILASPLLIIPYLFALSSWQNIKKYQLWLVYILCNLIFYFVIFDFSNRTIERYLMFLIIPGAIILGAVMSERLRGLNWKLGTAVFVSTAAITSALASLLFSLSYKIFPLNPKSAYFDAVRNLDFNFLLPITGGSGPTGFYVLVSFVIIFFVLALTFLILGRIFKKQGNARNYALVAILALGLVYNCILIRELAFGSQYGSVNDVTRNIVEKVNSNPMVDKVITYYDIGGYDLGVTGKYFLRFYTDPIFAPANKERFPNNRGFFMVVDFPQIDKNSVYWKYFESCRIVDMENDNRVNSFIFDCRNGDIGLFF